MITNLLLFGIGGGGIQGALKDIAKGFKYIFEFFKDPIQWIKNLILDLIIMITFAACKLFFVILQYILELIIDAILLMMQVFPIIVATTIVGDVQELFTNLAIALITLFFIYQLIKNSFAPLGFDGESVLNTLVMYFLVIVLLIFSNTIISALLQVTYEISQAFASSLKNFSSTIGSVFNGFITDKELFSNALAANGTTKIQVIAVNLLSIVLFLKVINVFLEVAYGLVMKMVSISILIMIGPLVISFGVLKSMRNIMTNWFRQLILVNISYVFYSVMMFYYVNVITEIHTSFESLKGYTLVELLMIAGIGMSITKAESVLAEVFSGQPTGGGGSGFGIEVPGPLKLARYASMAKGMFSKKGG